MPDNAVLVKRFKMNYASLMNSSKLPKGNTVRRIIEAYESKYGNRQGKGVLLTKQDGLDARSVDAGTDRSRILVEKNSPWHKSSGIVEKFDTENMLDNLYGSMSCLNISDIEGKEMTGALPQFNKPDIDDSWKCNYRSDAVKVPETFSSFSSADTYNNKDDYIQRDPSLSNSSDKRSLKTWKEFVSSMNKAESSDSKVERRSWSDDNVKGNNVKEFLGIKRRGQACQNSPVNKRLLTQCDPYLYLSQESLDSQRPSLRNIQRNSRVFYEDDEILRVIETLDHSGNSYKNLQVNMFDFENEGGHAFAKDSSSDPDIGKWNVQSNSEWTLNLSNFLDEACHSSEVNEPQSLQNSSSFVSERKLVEDVEIQSQQQIDAEKCNVRSESTMCDKSLRGKSLSKRLIPKFTRYIGKKIKSYVAENRNKLFTRQQQPSSIPLQPQPQAQPQPKSDSSPDSGFDEKSQNFSASMCSSISPSSSFNKTCNETPYFRTFGRRVYFRPGIHRRNIKKWKCLSEASRSHEKNAIPFVRSRPRMSTKALHRCKIEAPTSKSKKVTRSLSWLSYKLSKRPRGSTVKSKEVENTIERFEAPSPPPQHTSVTSSSLHIDDDSSWCSSWISATTLDRIVPDKSPRNVRKSVASRICNNYDIDEAFSSSSIPSLSTIHSYTQSDPCFATVMPRNRGFRIHPRRLRSFDNIKFNSIKKCKFI